MNKLMNWLVLSGIKVVTDLCYVANVCHRPANSVFKKQKFYTVNTLP
jgi:hypothetical protein